MAWVNLHYLKTICENVSSENDQDLEVDPDTIVLSMSSGDMRRFRGRHGVLWRLLRVDG